MNKEFDVALLHNYTPNEDRRPVEKRVKPLSPRPGVYGRLVIAAAKELYRQGCVNNFVISGGPGMGQKIPQSLTTALELARKTYVETQQIRINPRAPLTTNSELKFLRKVAQEKQSTKVVDIGCGLHKPRIELLAKRIFQRQPKIKITFLSAEEILLNLEDERKRERYRRVIDNQHQSNEDKKWSVYEQKALRIIKFPLMNEVLDLIARVYRPTAEK